jgi:CheY-like chemotaxis protein
MKGNLTVGEASQKPLILVVDDRLDARDLYTQYPGFHGFQVIEAEDGEQAIRLATEAMPVLILMDLGLPRMDGWEATRLIKTDPRTAHIRVLALTGHAFSDSVVRAKAAGVDAFFIKPCLPKTVLSKIREMLNLPHESG